MMECTLGKACFSFETLMYIVVGLAGIWLFMERGKFKPFVKSLGFALVVAFFLRGLLMEPYGIPSPSMVPTMLIGDYLYVSKLSYGYSKHSFPFLIPNIGEGKRLFGSEPERGDVAVFKLPSDTCTMYIKRVIGLPGDTVQMIKGVTYLNGQPLPQRRIEDFVEKASLGQVNHIPQFMEKMPSGREYPILRRDLDGTSPMNNTPLYKVPQGHYFMMGDNRDNSGDSRERVGFVPYDHLIGQAKFIFFSIDSNIFDIYKIWEWPEILRVKRFFSSIQADTPGK